jgi:hypothetical protein
MALPMMAPQTGDAGVANVQGWSTSIATGNDRRRRYLARRSQYRIDAHELETTAKDSGKGIKYRRRQNGKLRQDVRSQPLQ